MPQLQSVYLVSSHGRLNRGKAGSEEGSTRECKKGQARVAVPQRMG